MKRFLIFCVTLFTACSPYSNNWYEDESFLAGTWNISALEFTSLDCSPYYFYKYEDFDRYDGTVHFYLHQNWFSEEITENFSFERLCEYSRGSIDGNKCVINDSTFYNAGLCEFNNGQFHSSSSSCNITTTNTKEFSIPNDINMNDIYGSEFCTWDFNDEQNSVCGKIYIKSNGNNGAVKMISIATSFNSGCRYMLLIKTSF